MPYLSEVFSYISYFRRRGHQIGRKVGDMLELLTLGALARDHELASRLHIEPKIVGNSKARHKVEFALSAERSFNVDGSPAIQYSGDIADLTSIIGFIECKKVGVEQTINTSFKSKYQKQRYVIPYGDTVQTGFQRNKVTYDVRIEGTSASPRIRVTETVAGVVNEVLSAGISQGDRVIFARLTDSEARVLGNDESLRDVPQTVRDCRILEIREVHTAGVSVMLNECLPGPQTPEKAKQTSFVALDIRKKRFGTFDIRPEETELVSITVLTEYAHWEEKSVNMIVSAVDYNLVIDDLLVINAFEKFETKFGLEDFYDRITKDAFKTDADVRHIIEDVVSEADGRIFRDIADNKYKKIVYCDGAVRVF